MSWQCVIITIISTTFNLFTICSGAPGLEILEPLEDQYGLIGSNVSIKCQTRGGTEAFWVLNRTAITISHQSTKQYYEAIGVVFSQTESEGYYNLTMIVPAILSMNNTSIVCTARNSMMNGEVENSNVVDFIVFNNFRPYPPSVSVDLYYSPPSPPAILTSIHGLPRWPGYEMSKYMVNITVTSNNSLLHRVTIPNTDLENNSASFNWSPQKSIAEDCSTLRISVSAVSDAHGESELAQIDVQLLKAVELVNDQLKCTILFYSNGTISQLLIQVKLPDVCSYQQINYTIIVEEEVGDAPAAMNVVLNGPHYHRGPGTVSHQILSGLENDRVYSARVQVNHFTGITESTKHFFDTKLHSAIPCKKSFSKGTDESSFTLAMGVSLGTVVLLLMALLVAFMCFCVYTQRFRKKPQSECSANNRAMIHNPLYDGNSPMYESILGDMVQCRPTDSIQPMTTAADHTEREARQTGRYVGEPSQLLISQNQQRRLVLQSNTYDHLSDHKGNGIETTAQSNSETEEPYTFMSPAGTLTANINNY